MDTFALVALVGIAAIGRIMLSMVATKFPVRFRLSFSIRNGEFKVEMTPHGNGKEAK